MSTIKVMTIVGTRPELIKLSRVINELDEFVNHVLVHSGQNYDYELNEIFFKELSLRKPNYFLDAAANSLAQTIGNIIAKSDEIMEKENPDAVLILGDTNSCLSVISAKRRKIPVFHMEAGNRCFDERVPEEINRRMIDHISDINMTYTEHARRYLIEEGIKGNTIIKIGSPMKEVLEYHAKQIEESNVLDRLSLKRKDYFIVSAHREENIDDMSNFRDIMTMLQSISTKYDKRIIVSTHPRTRNRLEDIGGGEVGDNVLFLKPFGFFDYIKLQMNAFCVISDSGTITEESSILNFPAVMIRQAHERPEGMDEGALIMSGLNSTAVTNSIDIVTSQFNTSADRIKTVQDYMADNVSKKVVRIIASYIDYINRTVWFKNGTADR